MVGWLVGREGCVGYVKVDKGCRQEEGGCSCCVGRAEDQDEGGKECVTVTLSATIVTNSSRSGDSSFPHPHSCTGLAAHQPACDNLHV